MAEQLTLYVISHTHWDREWYESFQDYRFRLVRFIDDLLDIMERNDDYKYFHFDGQTILLDDYLEIRPDHEERLKRLIRDGRIIIGPWYVMPDEFLVSGESLVRNLQRGIATCRKYQTEYMDNGYVTDIFGHNGQFPQILNGFGIRNATLFRGAGNYPKDLFRWVGTDGSAVTAYRLDPDRCYSNFYFSVRWPFEGKEKNNDDLIRRAREMIDRSRESAVTSVLLMMDGVDHIDADPDVPGILEQIAKNIDGITVRHASMMEYSRAIEDTGAELDSMEGPLYHLGEKGLNNRVLKNVLSSMVHLKQANERCETGITGWAEPLDFAARTYIRPAEAAGGVPVERAGFIRKAWKYILQNHPHDSICGCSITDVHKDNEYRFRQAQQIIDRISTDAMEEISGNIDTSKVDSDLCYTIYNSSQKELDEYLVFTIDLPVGVYQNFRLFDAGGFEIPCQLIEVGDTRFRRDAPIRKLINFEPYEPCKIAAKLHVPANGHTTLYVKKYVDIGPGAGEYKAKAVFDKSRYLGTMRTGRNTWDNGRIILTAASNGTLQTTNKATGKVYENILAFEDCADVGEGWNYVKPVMDSEYLSICGECDVAIEADGPFAVVLKLTRRLMLPVDSSPMSRNSSRKMLEIASLVTLVKDSNELKVTTSLDNDITNHRVRVLFPTAIKAEDFYTLTPFDMQKWPVAKTDFSTFNEMETFVNPAQGVTFISDGTNSVELYTKGLYEVEVCENDSTIALTLFRAFSREVGQGDADMGHMRRAMSFEYAIAFHGGRTPSQALLDGMKFKLGLKTCAAGRHSGQLPDQMSYFEISCSTSILSAIYTESNNENGEGYNIIRTFNPSQDKDEISILFHRPVISASMVDFTGKCLEELVIANNRIIFHADGHKIITISFRLG